MDIPTQYQDNDESDKELTEKARSLFRDKQYDISRHFLPYHLERSNKHDKLGWLAWKTEWWACLLDPTAEKIRQCAAAHREILINEFPELESQRRDMLEDPDTIANIKQMIEFYLGLVETSKGKDWSGHRPLFCMFCEANDPRKLYVCKCRSWNNLEMYSDPGSIKFAYGVEQRVNHKMSSYSDEMRHQQTVMVQKVATEGSDKILETATLVAQRRLSQTGARRIAARVFEKLEVDIKNLQIQSERYVKELEWTRMMWTKTAGVRDILEPTYGKDYMKHPMAATYILPLTCAMIMNPERMVNQCRVFFNPSRCATTYSLNVKDLDESTLNVCWQIQHFTTYKHFMVPDHIKGIYDVNTLISVINCTLNSRRRRFEYFLRGPAYHGAIFDNSPFPVDELKTICFHCFEKNSKQKRLKVCKCGKVRFCNEHCRNLAWYIHKKTCSTQKTSPPDEKKPKKSDIKKKSKKMTKSELIKQLQIKK